MPVADVLIPAYNAAATLRETVASIQRQTLTDIQIHIVNDGSTDPTLALARELAAADSRMIVHDKLNGGIVDTLNHGLGHCHAEFLVRIDADDLAFAHRIEVQIAYLRLNPEVAGVAGAMRHVDQNGRWLGTVAEMGPPDEANPWAIPAREPYLVHSCFTARRSAYAAIGGYRRLHYCEDSDLYWRMRAVGRLVNLTEVLGDYRMHQGSVSSGSILNGRILAIISQLCAVSAQRRAAGRADVAFHEDDAERFRALRTLPALINFASGRLDVAERPWFTRAVVAKLLELTAYRPYEMDADDCAFAGSVARQGFPGLTSRNRAMVKRQLAGAAARIANDRRLGDAFALLPAAVLPSFAARYALRRVLPDPIRRRLRRGGTRTAPVK